MFTKLLDALRIARDDFKSKSQQIISEKKSKLETIDSDFIKGSPSQLKEVSKVEELYNKKMDVLRTEAAEYIDEYFAEVRSYETARVHKFDTATLKAIRNIADIPMSYSELQILNEFYGKNNNYWVEKMLVEIAEKNGISAEKLGLEASFEEKMNVLNQLENQFLDMINNYDGEPTVKNGMYLHDSVLAKADKQYRNGFENLSGMQMAQRAFGLLSVKGTLTEQAMAIQNFMRNADELTKAEFIYLISNSGIIEDAIKHSGCLEEFQKFKKNNMTEYSRAKDVFKAVKCAKEVKEVENAMMGNENNPFIQAMLESEKGNYRTIREYLGTDTETFENNDV